MKTIVFIDSEINAKGQIMDLGAVKSSGEQFHAASQKDFVEFVHGCPFVCGHNILAHDLKYLTPVFERVKKGLFRHAKIPTPIDTLPLSPLLFPKRPYHALLKDDKLQSDDLNNPLNDAVKAQQLFYDEVNAFSVLPEPLKQIYVALLFDKPEFSAFFQYLDCPKQNIRASWILHYFEGKICAHADVESMVQNYPVELAYALALVEADDRHSITPPWVLHHYPKVDNLIKLLRNTSCNNCAYCLKQLDVRSGLKQVFGFDNFRTYDGEPLQEKAAEAAMQGESLLAVFPTGGGKSLTFQLPAIMQGEAVHGLTVVISPLQSLMKDQVDNLEERGFVDAVTINGLLSPLERADAIRRAEDGSASLLYISPEQLRSKTIERLMLKRNIVRFVIDEAHCFSAWGQDFRVDYLYIGPFIKQLQELKHISKPIPVSCFTATAKQKVISDICDYFKNILDLDLQLFTSKSTRKNLHYVVLYKETDDEKYFSLRSLVEQKNCNTIVYVSRTKQTNQLAQRLTDDGFPALPFNGKMDPKDKVANQEAFMKNEVKVMVATSAFGMGVDKKDVKLVVHYDISDSLENYVQEAGRAGRDESLQAECYVLFNENDLNKHFTLLNQTKLTMSEIQQVWKAIKDLTKRRFYVTCSALEVARQAGWDDSVHDIETRIRTAMSALETAGYIQRGKNSSHLYATSIMVKNMDEAVRRIDQSGLFNEQQKIDATRIIKSLITSKNTNKSDVEAESRVDYLADILGVEKDKVIESVSLLRQAKVLADSQDMSAYIRRTGTNNRTLSLFKSFSQLERFLINQLIDGELNTSLKELNESALDNGIAFSSTKNIKSILHFWMVKGIIQKNSIRSDQRLRILPLMKIAHLQQNFEERMNISLFLIEELFKLSENKEIIKDEVLVQFSLIALYESYKNALQQNMFARQTVSLQSMEDALLYLSKMGIMPLDGGFMVLYNGMTIKRLIQDNKIRYKKEDYSRLNDYYRQKIQQIHIVGEYANLMVRDYDAALQFVGDYFQMDYKRFITKYFKGERAIEIERNITPEKYKALFGELSEVQRQIINDQSQYIVVAAGPGSGKTRVLVHKLASLLMMEDVKHEQLLMLTFSRAAATEFKQRLFNLIGSVAAYVEIKTFHSYCFDLLGKIGCLENAGKVVEEAVRKIATGEVEMGRITKSVLVIDEAQDMDANEFALVEALMNRNDDLRMIAVGDDDQNIYEFRGSNSKYFSSLVTNRQAKFYELVDNFRSKKLIVNVANKYVQRVDVRMKNKPCRAISSENGAVELIRYSSSNLEQPIANHICAHPQKETCVLTNTNEEALQVCSMLNRLGVRAQLIQSNDGFRLYDLVEVRFFLKYLKKNQVSPVISDDLWNAAKADLQRKYSRSHCLPQLKNMITVFENSNAVKYYTDFDEFVDESKFEDFYNYDQDCVVVSTIHKAKGREFDVVYLLLNGVDDYTDEQRHKLYVGITRAKSQLYIHYNNKIFDDMRLPGVSFVQDMNCYEEPEELMLQLTHRDVFLGFFKDKKKDIFSLQSGDSLEIDGNFLCALIGGRRVCVAKYSKSFEVYMEQLRSKGYQPSAASVRFIVAWKGEDDEEESAVLLPNVVMRKAHC